MRSFELSSYREHIFEQTFCAELLQGCWRAGFPALEIDGPFVDFQAYYLVATCGQVTRHIQLKATRGRIAVHRALAQKPSACVVNLEVERDDPPIEFRYRYFGGAPGERMSLDGFAPAPKAFNTRDVTSGEFRKAEREHHVVVPPLRFSKPMDILDLAHTLFG